MPGLLKPSGTKIRRVLAKEKMENYLALRLDEQDKALRDVVDELQRVQEKLGVRGFFCLMGGMLTFFGLKTEGSVKDFQQLQSHRIHVWNVYTYIYHEMYAKCT